MDILNKISDYLVENAVAKHAKAQSLGLTHISFNNYEDKSGQDWHWDGKDFAKGSQKLGSQPDKDEKSFELVPAKKKVNWDDIDEKTVRKPDSWEEVINGDSIKLSELPSGLPTYDDNEIYASGFAAFPFSKFKKSLKLPQRFILSKGNKRFYVNTEGYDYARYIASVVKD